MKRRVFLGVTAASCLGGPAVARSAARLRVAVIGHTGRGNYGHGLDTVWLRLPEQFEVVGVADADAEGLRQAKQRLRVEAGYANYEDLLAATRPDIVAVCPRHPDQHAAMILAAIEAGTRGIYCEKPFCRTPAEADAILDACQQHQTQLAVAHRNRYHPVLQAVDKMIEQGQLGKLLEIRGRGKGDRRGGSEDLWVLGSHVFNLFDYFGKGVRSCSASVLQQGRPIIKDDVHAGNEGLGPLAGDEVHARFQLADGLVAYFDSLANDGTQSAGFGLQLIGSQGIVDLKIDRDPLAHWLPGNPFAVTSERAAWTPISSAGPGVVEPIAGLAAAVSHHETAVLDLADSMRAHRPPLCDARAAATTVEMIHAVFASGRQRGQAHTLPLRDRRHQLEVW